MRPAWAVLAASVTVSACDLTALLPFVVPAEFSTAVLAVRSEGVPTVFVLDREALDASLRVEVSDGQGEAVILLYREPPDELELSVGRLRVAQSEAEGGNKLPASEVTYLADDSAGIWIWRSGQTPEWLRTLLFPSLSPPCPDFREVGRIELAPLGAQEINVLAPLSDGRILVVANGIHSSFESLTKIYTLTASVPPERSAVVLTATLALQPWPFSGFGELDGRGWLASIDGALRPLSFATGQVGPPTALSLGLAPVSISGTPDGLFAASGTGCIARLRSGEADWSLVPGTETLCRRDVPSGAHPQVLALSATVAVTVGWGPPREAELLRVQGDQAQFECVEDELLLNLESVAMAGDGSLCALGRMRDARRGLYRTRPGARCPWERRMVVADLIRLSAVMLPSPKGKGVVYASDHGGFGAIEGDRSCPLLTVTGIDPAGWDDLKSIVALDSVHFLVASPARSTLWIIRVE